MDSYSNFKYGICEQFIFNFSEVKYNMNLILLFVFLHHASLKMCRIQIVICEQILDLTP